MPKINYSNNMFIFINSKKGIRYNPIRIYSIR